MFKLSLLALVATLLSAATASATIALRGSATTGTTANTSLTINKPAGVVAGDVMLVNIAQRGNNTTAPSSSGWTLIAGGSLAGSTARYGAVLYRVAGATEGASYTFTLGSGTTSAVGDIVAYSGVDTSGATPFDATPGTISVQVSQTAVSATSITTVSANAAVIMFGMAANAPTWSGWTTTSPGALTELYDNQSASASVGAAWAVKAAAGATGAGAATLSAKQRNGGILIALKPRAAATTTMSAGGTSTYGGAVTFTATVTPNTASGAVNFLDGATLLGSGTLSGTTTKTASYTATGNQLSAGTHSAIIAIYQGDAGRDGSTSPAITQTVNSKALSVSGLTANNKAYDATTTATLGGAATLLAPEAPGAGTTSDGKPYTGDTVTLGGTASGTFSGKDVANGIPVTVTGNSISGTQAGNYTLTQQTGLTANITGRALTIRADPKSKTYGDADPALTYQITSGSLAGSDSLIGTLTRAAGANVGSYAIQQGTLAASGNYALTYSGANLSITARPITVTAVADNKLYDGTTISTNVPTLTAGSLAGSDTATWTQVFNTKDTTATTLIPSGSVSDGNGGNNYNVTFVSVPTHSINPRGLTVAANDATRVYGAPNPAFSFSYSGFVAGETASVLSGSPSLSTAADINSGVNGGPYDINVSTNGVTALNYYLAPAKGHLTITPASATVGVLSDKWTVPPTNTVTFAFAALPNAPSIVKPSGSVQFIANGTNNLGSPVSLDSNGQAALPVLGSALVHGSNTITAVFTDANGNFTGASSDLNPKQVVNIAPNRMAHGLGAVYNTPVSFTTSQLVALDKDADKDPLTILAIDAVGTSGGTIVMASGTITYTPPPNYAGSDSFNYTITDPFGGVTNSTVSVGVKLTTNISSINHVYPQADGSQKLVAFALPGKTYTIQASSDMVHWTNLTTNVVPSSSVITFFDLDATNYPVRLYRLLTQ